MNDRLLLFMSSGAVYEVQIRDDAALSFETKFQIKLRLNQSLGKTIAGQGSMVLVSIRNYLSFFKNAWSLCEIDEKGYIRHIISKKYYSDIAADDLLVYGINGTEIDVFDPNDKNRRFDGPVAILQTCQWNGLLVRNRLITLTHPTGVSRYDLGTGQERQVMGGG